jgi:hypothetical protein
MGSFSLWHWIIVIAFSLLWIIPLVRILRRTGKSPWWALIGIFILWGPLIVLWIIAYGRWPKIDKEANAA